MDRRFLPPIVALVALGLLGGCAHDVSLAEIQAASYARHRETRVEGEALADFIRQRSAILLDGAKVTAGRIDTGASALQLEFEGARTVGTAAATAIDARGYFICTATAVTRGPHTLVVHDAVGFRVLPARVVWRGDYSRGEPEIALLHVDRPLLHVFAWAPTWHRKQPVIGAGTNFAGRNGGLLSLFGGRLVRSTTRQVADGTHVSFFHSAPVHAGDSGGPLTDVEGRLLGVNLDTLRRFSFQRLSYRTTARAFRPGSAWLQRLIEADFQRTLHAPSPSAARP